MRLQFVRVAMVERIVSELSDKAYETTLVIYAACVPDRYSWPLLT